jgi:hypothetical protein
MLLIFTLAVGLRDDLRKYTGVCPNVKHCCPFFSPVWNALRDHTADKQGQMVYNFAPRHRLH